MVNRAEIVVSYVKHGGGAAKPLDYVKKHNIPNRDGTPFEIECDRIKHKVTEIKDAVGE